MSQVGEMVSGHAGPWTEQDYRELPEDGTRIKLLDRGAAGEPATQQRPPAARLPALAGPRRGGDPEAWRCSKRSACGSHPAGPSATVHQLDGGRYRLLAAAAPGDPLSLTDPFPVLLDLPARSPRPGPGDGRRAAPRGRGRRQLPHRSAARHRSGHCTPAHRAGPARRSRRVALRRARAAQMIVDNDFTHTDVTPVALPDR